MVAPLAVSVKVVPFTVSLSSVSVTPLATVTPPLFRQRIADRARTGDVDAAEHRGSPVPLAVPSLTVPPLMVTPRQRQHGAVVDLDGRAARCR